MKIVLLSTSDITGGAAVVSKRLVEALRMSGHDARMLVLNRHGESPGYIKSTGGMIRRLPFYCERAGIYSANGTNRTDLFKVSTASSGVRVRNNPLVRDADVIMLGWVNQGFLSLKEIYKLGSSGKPVIWTMHDMWCFTGICHLSENCEKYKAHCGDCPFLHNRRSSDDLSAHTWRKKKELYGHPNIRFVAVSNWLAKRAKESSLLGDRDIYVIPNAFKIPELPVLNEGQRKPVIAMGASRLDDPVKNLPLAIDALNLVYDKLKDSLPGLKAKFFGNIRDPKAFSGLRMPYEWLGPLNEKEIADVFNNSKAVLSTSFFEMLPTTIIEGLAWGCRAVSTSSGGQEDIITDGQNGFLVPSLSSKDVAEALKLAMLEDPGAGKLRQSVEKRFDSQSVALKYMEVIEQSR